MKREELSPEKLAIIKQIDAEPWPEVYAGCDSRPENYDHGMVAINSFLGGDSSEFLSDFIDNWRNKNKS